MDRAHQSSVTAASYDDVPYDSDPLIETHPDSLAAAAILVGIDAPPIEGCRVLELGCATGANLIPIAASLPGARMLGIDVSPRQIAAGQSLIEGAGLSNITLRSMDILDFDDSFGQFDYIISHGVYSWVPPLVREKLLDICTRNLSDRGVVYLSYNTYPGWHLRGMVRNMLCHHAGQFADPKTRIQQARALLEFLARSTDPKSAFGLAIKEVADFLRPHVDAYIYHEFLEVVNDPLYFHQFVERLAARKLKYFGEAWLPPPAYGLSPEVANALAQFAPDAVQLEQYADFVINRTFRRSMLCHDWIPTAAASTGQVQKLHVGTLVGPVSPTPDLRSTASESFRGKEDLVISTSTPVLKAALVALSAVWPAALPFDALWDETHRRLGGGLPPQMSESSGRQRLAEQLLGFYRLRVISLHAAPLRLVGRPSARPLASALARYQSRCRLTISNLRHHTVDLSEFDRLVLAQLDGANDEAAIVEAIALAIEQGTVQVEPYLRAASPQQRRAIVNERLRASLLNLARKALLER